MAIGKRSGGTKSSDGGSDRPPVRPGGNPENRGPNTGSKGGSTKRGSGGAGAGRKR